MTMNAYEREFCCNDTSLFDKNKYIQACDIDVTKMCKEHWKRGEEWVELNPYFLDNAVEFKEKQGRSWITLSFPSVNSKQEQIWIDDLNWSNKN